jgi:hypothetical protein
MAKKSGKATAKRNPIKVAAKKTVSQKTAAKPRPKAQAGPRRLKRPVKLPSAWRLAETAAKTLWQYKRLFIGITLVYALLDVILVQGLSGGTDVSTLKHTLSQASAGHFGGLGSGLRIFVVLLGSAGSSSSAAASVYQMFLVLIASLAVIWALRQVLAGSIVRVRDAYYRGMYPLVPFILVILTIILQLVPVLVGAAVYSLVINNGVAVSLVEKLAWSVAYLLLALLSLYMISSSLFALYVVTLPDMAPRKALRSARELVRHRRWTVLRKILCLPIILLIVAAVIMLPVIAWLTPLARWLFFLLTTFSLVAVHAYMYTLYRELLNE